MEFQRAEWKVYILIFLKYQHKCVRFPNSHANFKWSDSWKGFGALFPQDLLLIEDGKKANEFWKPVPQKRKE